MKSVRAFSNIIKNLYMLLERKQRIKGIWVFICILIGASVETLGIAAILPFFTAVLNAEAMLENKYIFFYANFLGIKTSNQLICSLGIGICIIYVVKNIILMAVTYIQSSYISSIRSYLSTKMLTEYLSQEYVFFTSVNSSEIIRGVNSDVISVSELLECIFKIFSIVFMILGIMIFIGLSDPYTAMGIVVLAISIVIIIMVITKRKTKHIGEKKREIESQVFSSIYQAISGIKEIIILGRQNLFLNRYKDVMKTRKKVDVSYACILALPDRIIESGFIIGMIAIVCMKIVLGNTTTQTIASLSILAVAAMRVLPSLSTLSTRMTQLVYLQPALQAVASVMNRAEDKQQDNNNQNYDYCQKKSFSDSIELKNISWKYPDSDQYIFENVFMKIKKGESVALIGKSGAGKTTLVDVILGLLHPCEGSVQIDGNNLSEHDTWRNIVGYVPQDVFLIDDSIRNNVMFGLEKKDDSDESVWHALEEAQLKEYVESLPERLDTSVGESGVRLSGGQRQRLAIARALYQNPELVVFDEATASLDYETEEAVMEAIDNLHGKKTLIIIAHRLNTIKKCDSIYMVENGVVAKTEKKE